MLAVHFTRYLHPKSYEKLSMGLEIIMSPPPPMSYGVVVSAYIHHDQRQSNSYLTLSQTYEVPTTSS